jgi:hypothetical protein
MHGIHALFFDASGMLLNSFNRFSTSVFMEEALGIWQLPMLHHKPQDHTFSRLILRCVRAHWLSNHC